MFTDQLTLLQQFLANHRLHHTAQILRQELLARVPVQPSAQLVALTSPPPPVHAPSVRKEEKVAAKKKKNDMLAEGLLGKIAYSGRLLEDAAINDQITRLLDNKIYQKAVGRMFPEAASQIQQLHPDPSHTPTSEEEPSAIMPQEESSIVSQPSELLQQMGQGQPGEDEYADDNDMGYHEHQFDENELMRGCAKLTEQYGYPQSAVKSGPAPPSVPAGPQRKFTPSVKFPQTNQALYPLEYNGTIFDCLDIKVVRSRESIEEEEKGDEDWAPGEVLMGRWQVEAFLGNGVFARVLRVKDKVEGKVSCFKVLSNNKDFLDQALDEIKLLRLIKANCDPDAEHIINFKEVYYYRQRLIIETDLLRDDLYSAYRKNPSFFSVAHIRVIARQLMVALSRLHSLSIIHSDLKPENILIECYSPLSVKVVDFGNSCFLHDHLGTYVQSRSYRAPEVILGTPYDNKVDIWSIGCILAELWTKNVLFYNLHVPGMLARMQSILGPWPEWMLEQGNNVSNFFSKENLIFFEEEGQYHILLPKRTSLVHRIRTQDAHFLSFIGALLQVDPHQRPSAQQALNHPFLRAE